MYTHQDTLTIVLTTRTKRKRRDWRLESSGEDRESKEGKRTPERSDVDLPLSPSGERAPKAPWGSWDRVDICVHKILRDCVGTSTPLHVAFERLLVVAGEEEVFGGVAPQR
jgi:hypothetical protein